MPRVALQATPWSPAKRARGVIVEDDLDRGRGGVGGLQHSKEFDELATAVAVLDEGVHLAGQRSMPAISVTVPWRLYS